MSYTHLSAIERGQIEVLVEQGIGMRAIGRALGRHPATIGRELRRNSVGGVYEAPRAQKRYKERRRECRPGRKLDHRPLWKYLWEKLPLCWSPEQIAGRLRLEYPNDPAMRISHETLYRHLYTDARLAPMVSHLRQSRPKRRRRGQGKTSRAIIPNRTSIHERPLAAQERGRFGDWEGDLLLGKKQRGALVTLAERKSLMLLARKVATKHTEEVMAAVIDALEHLPASWARTISFDNGTEFSHHQRITDELGVPTFFADPYAAWQRPINENTNGLIRQYLPKGTSMENLTQPQLEAIVNELNNRPRKTLGFRTPYEVFEANRKTRPVALSA